MWAHREVLRPALVDDPYPRAAERYAALLAKLDDEGPTAPENVIAAPILESIEFDRLNSRLLEIRDMDPHPRGYAFEAYLKTLFDAFRLNAREPFRLVGEQIDGSFELAGETYLVEAKWLNRKVGVAELGAFHSKLDQKATWARGLFISFGGFTEEGLTGFGRGRRLIGMDGRDIHLALTHGLPINRMIELKVRHAAETGAVFAPIDTLIS
ncbi:hypothetical protein D3C80_1186050 [compost metagenome]